MGITNKFEFIGMEHIHSAEQAFEVCTGKMDTSDLSPQARMLFLRSIKTMFYSGLVFALTMVVEDKQHVSNDVAETRMRNMLGEAMHWLATEGSQIY